MLTPKAFMEEMQQLAYDYSAEDYETFVAKGTQLMRKTLAELGCNDEQISHIRKTLTEIGHNPKSDTSAMCAALRERGYEYGVVVFQCAPRIDMESAFRK